MTVSSQVTPTGRRSPGRPEQQWFVVSRWSEYEGEARTNLLRIVAIGVFYAIELLSYYGLHLVGLNIEPAVDRPFHEVVTALAVAWALIALVTQLCLQAKIFSSALKYVTTTCDMALLTLVVLAGDGPRSAMVVGFFLIIALATLRLGIGLIWYATAGSLVGYLVILCCASWYPPADRDLSVPRYEQLTMLAAIAIEGVILGQVVRQVGRVAADYARRIEQA